MQKDRELEGMTKGGPTMLQPNKDNLKVKETIDEKEKKRAARQKGN
jgi:hypothetical protein